MVVDGMHRLSIALALGRQKTRAVILPARPTRLQSLVAAVSQTQKLKELYQPIGGMEFDRSWTPVRQCHDRFEMMVKFLTANNDRLSELSVVVLGCPYGWFVSEFSKRGCFSVGMDINPKALRVGQVVYGLNAEQLEEGDQQRFLGDCDRTYDVVLLLSTLHHLTLNIGLDSVKEILKRIDGITGTVLFLDTEQSHERGYGDSLFEWDNEFIIQFIMQHTSFDHVIPLRVDSDNVGSLHDHYGRTLFACIRL